MPVRFVLFLLGVVVLAYPDGHDGSGPGDARGDIHANACGDSHANACGDSHTNANRARHPDGGVCWWVTSTGHWVDKAAIVAKVRAGQCIHGEQEAVPYANACEFNPAAMTGCYCIKCGSKSGIPVGLTYNFFLGPWFCFQPCLPLPLWCGCSDEREGNVYINRGRQGRGTVMVIDEEMGTLACYHCEEEANPCCTCVKIGK